MASAAPPLNIYSNDPLGLDVIGSVYEYYEAGKSAELIIHVFNKTTGIMLTRENGVNCTGNVFNKNGSLFNYVHADLEDPVDPLSWRFYYLDNVITESGIYSYTIWCNTSNAGGYIKGYFEITPDGNEEYINAPALNIFMFFAIFALALVFLIMAHVFKDDEGSAIVYSFISGTVFFILSAFIAFSAEMAPQGTSTPFLTIFAILGLYCYIYGLMFVSYIRNK